jgi:hypothetical protein
MTTLVVGTANNQMEYTMARGSFANLDRLVSLTASQISAQISREIARTYRTSRQQSLGDRVNRSPV